jgi:hypothetical protein
MHTYLTLLWLFLSFLVANEEDSNYWASNDQQARKLSGIQTREVGAGGAIGSFAELNENPAVIDPQFDDTVVSRAERLQSSGTLDDSERRKRRNDALFLGKSLLI